MLDRFVRRWLGPLLLGTGGVTLLYGVALLVGWAGWRPAEPPSYSVRSYAVLLHNWPAVMIVVALVVTAAGVRVVRYARRERAYERARDERTRSLRQRRPDDSAAVAAGERPRG